MANSAKRLLISQATSTVWINGLGEWTGTHVPKHSSGKSRRTSDRRRSAQGVSNIAKGDDLTIVGSQVKYQDSEFMIAREIMK